MGAPLELSEGRIKRLHISGDWSYSAGIRPRIEIAGVRIVARVRPPSAAPRPPDTNLQSHASSTTAPKPQAPVLRSLLRRICCDVTDVQFVAVDTLAAASRSASFGFTIQSISTETPEGSRSQSPRGSGPTGAASAAGSSSSHGAASSGVRLASKN
jgi:hypothetical protein